jgi:hypothetical protein
MGGGRHWKQPATAPQTLPYEAWPECHDDPIPTIGGSTDIGPGASLWMDEIETRPPNISPLEMPQAGYLGQKRCLAQGGTPYAG